MTTQGERGRRDREDAMRDVWRAMSDLFFSAENQARFSGAAVELGISPPMLRGLLDLEPGEAVPMRSLATQWQCDPSFVTVVVDGLEKQGYVERRVASHDRRVKTVQLTDDGVAVRESALDAVYAAPTAFWELRPHEQATLARLLRKLADAQALYDSFIVEGQGEGHCGPPALRAGVVPPADPVLGAPPGTPGGPNRGRPPRGGRTRMGPMRGRAGASPRARAAATTDGDALDEPGSDTGWRSYVEAHQRELRQLRDELARVRDEVRAQVRRPVDEAKAATTDTRAELRAARDEFTAAKSDLKAARDELKSHLKGQRPPR